MNNVAFMDKFDNSVSMNWVKYVNCFLGPTVDGMEGLHWLAKFGMLLPKGSAPGRACYGGGGWNAVDGWWRPVETAGQYMYVCAERLPVCGVSLCMGFCGVWVWCLSVYGCVCGAVREEPRMTVLYVWM